jgi:hypothetical protein
MDIDQKGRLYAVDSFGMRVFRRDGPCEPMRMIMHLRPQGVGRFCMPMDLAVDNDERIFLGCIGKILYWDCVEGSLWKEYD